MEGNYLSGGQYTIYVDDSKVPTNKVGNFNIRNNTIKKGRYGYTSLYTSGVSIDSSNILD
jgi:hypothetical protein